MDGLIRKHFYLAGVYTLFTILVIWSSSHVFFWDTVQLGARHALFFFENPGAGLILPQEIDSGHIPLFGYFLSWAWAIFGQTLAVSHLVMLPFVLGIVWLSYRLMIRFIPGKYVFIAHLIFLLDPVLVTQMSLVSPDIVLVFFFLLALESMLAHRQWMLSIGLAGLVCTSNRGIVLAAAIGIFDVIRMGWMQNQRASYYQWISRALGYLPAFLIIIVYFYYHFKNTGWIIVHAQSPWAPCFEPVEIKVLFYNILIAGWRLMDFGRIFLVLLFLAALLFIKKESLIKGKARLLLVLLIIVSFVILIVTVPYKNLLAHRYLIPVNLLASLYILHVFYNQITSMRVVYFFSFIAPVVLLTGHLWLYPEGIAMGWDSTLAHTPYYHLRNDVIRFIDEKEIPVSAIGTGFPLTSQFRYSDLSGRTDAFSVKDLNKQQYILYSNIINDFTDDERLLLYGQWECIYETASRSVFFRLYKRKDSNPL